MYKRYKKLAVLFLAVNLMVAMGGCAKQEENKTENVVTETPAEDNTEETAEDTEITPSAKGEENPVAGDTENDEDSDIPVTEGSETTGDEEPAEAMKVQDNIDININENEEGAW